MSRAFTGIRPSSRREIGGRWTYHSCFSTTLFHISTKTLAEGSHISEMEVKKSRFIGYASHVDTWEQASQYIDFVKKEHPKARHWCYGYRGGMNPVTERSSDDGEPSGTAGSPILSAITGEELSDVICVVVRYFGGIKLGAGGLIRAYGATARQVIRESPVEVIIPKSQVRLRVNASHVGSVYESAAKISGETMDECFRDDGSLEVTILCETEQEGKLRKQLQDTTRGEVRFL